MKPATLDHPAARGAMLALGVGAMAVGYCFFLIPNRIAPGGFSGIATLLNYRYGLPVGLSVLVMNVPLFAVALRQQGAGFIARALAASALYSLLLDVLPADIALTRDMLLASVYGGALVGLGLGAVVRAGASTGGTDMLARLLTAGKLRVSFAAALFMIESVIVASSGIVFGPQSALYAVLSILITSKVIDIMQEGLNAAKAAFIVTRESDAISGRILSELGRGVTALSGRGMYSGEGREVLLCIVYGWETASLKRFVLQADPAAFMVVTDVREALGKGFSVWK